MIELELFHFLRPLWLLALPLIMLNWWLVRRRESTGNQANARWAPHLREALTVNRDSHGWFRPVDGVVIGLLAMTIAAAGPTWRKTPSPWFAETAPLVIAVEVSDSMRSNDLQPTRLDRARFKILDLVAQRTGSRTALIAYAGSAHVVMPPTKDLDVIKPFLESFDPAIMPSSGANASAVLPLARQLLGDQAAVATLLFVNDGFDAADTQGLAEFSQQSANPALAALVVGSDAGGVALMPDGSPVMDPSGRRLDTKVDAAALRRAAAQADMAVVRASNGDDDIRQLLGQIESNLRRADDPDARWRDEAWWLLWPAALLSLLWFRRGWTMQW
jgi:Ca-activated chloride channel family protein